MAWGVAHGALAAPRTVVLAPTPLEFPVRLGPMVLTGEPHKYEPAALGVSYQFLGKGLSLTVYVYDAGVKDIPDGGDSAAACEQLEEAKSGVAHANYPNTVLTTQQMVRLSQTEDLPLAREARYEFVRDGRAAISYIWVTAATKTFVKARFSLDKQLSDEEVDARRAVLDALGAAIKPYLVPVDPAAKKEGTTTNVTLDDNGDMMASILYSTTLTTLVEQSPDLAPVCGGTLVPTFELDVAAYRAVMEMSGAGLKSSFGARLASIEKAGFFEEFVWIDMHREEWGTIEPADLAIADYLKWRKKKLKRFSPPSLGSVTMAQPRPLPVEGAAAK